MNLPSAPDRPTSAADSALYALLDELSSQLNRYINRLPIEDQRRVLAPLLSATNLEIVPQ